MPIDAKEALAYLGYDSEKLESLEEFKKAYDAEFVRVKEAHTRDDIAGQIFGKANGAIRTKLNTAAKALGLELNKEELEKNPTEVIELLQSRLADKLAAIPELEKKLQGAAPADALKAWEEKYGTLEKRSKEWEQQAQAVAAELDKLKAEQKAKELQSVAEREWEQAEAGVKWRADVDALARRGLAAMMRDSYQVRVDEGKPLLVDKDGNRVPNPERAGTFYTIGELYQVKAKEAKLVETNPHAGRETGGQGRTIVKPKEDEGGSRSRVAISAAALEGEG